MFEKEYYFESDDHCRMFLLTQVKGKLRDMDLGITNRLFVDRIAATKWYREMTTWLNRTKGKFDSEDVHLVKEELEKLYNDMCTGG